MAAEWETQKALYTAISALGLTVYDAAPQVADGGSGANWPYVEVGAVVFAEWDTKPVTGFDFVARIHTRSRSGGMKEAKDIQGQIYDRMHLGELTITGYNLVLLRRESSDLARMADGSFHGICEYRGMIEKTQIVAHGPAFDSGFSLAFG
jgi:hypothetical protein